MMMPPKKPNLSVTTNMGYLFTKKLRMAVYGRGGTLIAGNKPVFPGIGVGKGKISKGLNAIAQELE